MNSNIDFQSVCLGTILYSSTEITYFSWQLYFFLVNFKSEIWQIYVIRRHHCQSTRRSYLPLLIFSYKGISILYYSMVLFKLFSDSKLFDPLKKSGICLIYQVDHLIDLIQIIDLILISAFNSNHFLHSYEINRTKSKHHSVSISI